MSTARSKRQIILLTIVLEGGLALFALLVWHYQSQPLPELPNSGELAWGIFWALPLLAMNLSLFYLIVPRFPTFKICQEFSDTYVKPLADLLDPGSALLVALCAGIGEEFFFRGLIQENLGLLIASALFALVHFISALRQFALLVFIYFLVGIYLGLIYQESQSLWLVSITHAAYDLLAILMIKYFYPSPKNVPSN